ncbi:MAG: DUF4019 domain-containing protein [Burkholderiales bacterium]
MQRFDRGRRLALAALSACALAAAVPAAAQDPNQSLAKAAALDWLALAGKHDAEGTWTTAAARFRGQITAEKWAVTLKQVQDRFGDVEDRTFIGARAVEPKQDDPQGTFLVLVFRTDFTKRKQGMETLTVEREADGKWRVVGYLMQ